MSAETPRRPVDVHYGKSAARILELLVQGRWPAYQPTPARSGFHLHQSFDVVEGRVRDNGRVYLSYNSADGPWDQLNDKARLHAVATLLDYWRTLRGRLPIEYAHGDLQTPPALICGIAYVPPTEE